MPQNTDIVRIPFYGDELLTVEVDGKPHVAFRPVVFALGIEYGSALKRLKRHHWASVVVTTIPDSDDPSRNVVVVDVRTLLMFLATIQTSRVAADIRPKLDAYQSEVADTIDAYWTRGQAVNPRASGMFEPHTLTWDETTAVLRQRYGIDLTVNELTRMLRTAGVLRQTGGPRKEHRHLLWFTGSSWTVHPHAVPQVAKKVLDTGRELQEFRFIQARLELDGLAENEIA